MFDYINIWIISRVCEDLYDYKEDLERNFYYKDYLKRRFKFEIICVII